MTAPFFSPLQMPETDKDALYLCLLDPEGRVRAANHPHPQEEGQSFPEMIRAVHGVRPHPDMPHSIYARMEARLLDRDGAAGYYLCLTPQDEMYCIALHIFKTAYGRMVTHLRVRSPKLIQFAKFFAVLRQAEIEGISQQESVRRLMSLMVSDDVSDYRSLATSIMAEELAKRDVGKGRWQVREMTTLIDILDQLRMIDKLSADIVSMSGRSKLIPYQLKLQAARLEGRSGPLSVVADNHQELTDRLLEVTDELQKASSTELDALIDAIAYVAQSYHADDLLDSPRMIMGDDAALEAEARQDLHQVMHDCAQAVRHSLASINSSLRTLNAICHRMRRAVAAMEMTNMMCKIERARLSQGTESLKGIEEQLHLVQSSLTTWMGQIDRNAATALSLAQRLKRVRLAAAA